MRYSREHKSTTRDHILDVAATLFRKHGYDGVGIDRLMAEAGLTRGGFYGHFASKQDLFAAVMSREADFVVRMRKRVGSSKRELTAGAMQVVRGYLAPANRERIGQGCMMASLSIDAARSSPEAQAGFAHMIEALTAEFARGLKHPEELDPRALRAIALCAGGIVLARAVGKSTLANAITNACLVAIGEELKR